VDRGSVHRAFEDPTEFTTSPLYRALSRTVARTGQLLELAARGRPGQYPTFLFFGAVHLLLLRGADHPLARYFPSVAGGRALPADEAGPALASFGKCSRRNWTRSSAPGSSRPTTCSARSRYGSG